MPQLNKSAIKCPCGKDAISKRDNFDCAETEFVHALGSCKFNNSQMRELPWLNPENHTRTVDNLISTIEELQRKLTAAMIENGQLNLSLQLVAKSEHGPWCHLEGYQYMRIHTCEVKAEEKYKRLVEAGRAK